MPIPNTKVFLNSAILSGGGYTLTPNAPGDLTSTLAPAPATGWVASVGDLNGDGIADVAVGAAGDDDKAAEAGRVYVMLGDPAPGSTVGVADGVLGQVDTWIIDGVNAGDMTGFAIAGSGDMNGNGRGELLIGAPGMARGTAADAGTAFVAFGPAVGGGLDLGDLLTSGSGEGFAIRGQSAGDMAGYSVMSVGDLNGDGRADVLVGAPGQDAGGTDAGAAYIVWGKAGDAPVLLSNVAAGTGGFKITGASSGDAVGTTLGVSADQNGDGRAEILIGVPDYNDGAPNQGAVYVVFGKATGTGVDLNNIAAGIGGYIITGVEDDDAGAAVAGVADVNGDGRGDILIGAPRSDRAYVVFGKTDTAAVDLADVRAGIGGYEIIAENAGDLDGLVVLGGGDLNRDGIADLILGVPGNEEGGTNAGAVYIVWGGGQGPIDLAAVAQGFGGAKIVGAPGSLTGSTLALSPDLNGDGTQDLMIGAPGSGEAVKVLFAPASWQPDLNIYGTEGADLMGPGFGGVNQIDAGNDAIMGLGGDDTIAADAGDDMIEGGAGNDSLDGDAGNDTLDGGTGADAMNGGLGNDTYIVDSAGDTVSELGGDGVDTVYAGVAHTLADGVENLILTGAARSGTGNALANSLTGTAGADTLDGAAGADTMAGGLGNDRYIVDDLGDAVTELAGGGTADEVVSSINITLAAEVERLVLTGAARIGTGNALSNYIAGTVGDDRLDGLAGADTMAGGAGNDTYIVDATADQVVELAGGGTADRVNAYANFTLGAEVEQLYLYGSARAGTGNALNNLIVGTGGADTLDGGAGIDTLTGGAGGDTYRVDNAADKINETATGGIDTVIATVNYTLGAYVENLTLSGAARVATGNGAANRLVGTGFDDTLNGGGGADTMEGGAGNDVYKVDNAGDVVIDTAGSDRVDASISYTLTAGIEALRLTAAGLTGTGTAGADALSGSAGSQTLIGLEGADTLDGGSGADMLIGGAGDDTYIIDDIGDVIVEDIGGGTDTVVLMANGLTAPLNVEIIRLGGTATSATGGAGNNTLSGGIGDDSLDGGDGDDLLNGGRGDDDLYSRGGSDTLVGDDGDDVYHISGGSVTIEDYSGRDCIDSSESTTNDYIDLSGETESEIEGQVVVVTPGGTTSRPLDVQFLQDRSGSFGDDIATVRGLVPQIVAALQAVQANSAFGVSSFIDKPVGPFGAAGEWVYALEQAMTTSAATLASIYNSMNVLNGADGPEAQIEGLMQLALNAAAAGYRTDAARFVVLFTDAPYHVAGDGALGGIFTPNNGDAFYPGGGALEDYPQIPQLMAALQAANIIPIFAVAGGYETTYQGLVTQIGRGTVVSLTADSSNIVAAITAGMTAATTTTIEEANAGSGDDTVIGGGEDNSIRGNAGNDSIEGRAGDDSIEGGLGDDDLKGGDGDDTFLVGLGQGADAIDGGIGLDRILATAANVIIGLESVTGIEEISAGGFANVSVKGTALADLLDFSTTTLTGITLIDGDLGNDTINGSAGADTISGGAGNDLIQSGGGDDVIRVSGAGAGRDVVDGGAGYDVIRATANGTAISLTSVTGIEEISAGGKTGVTLRGSDAADRMDYSGITLTGITNISGGKGNDTMTGSAGGDVITGGAGRDVMTGGLGADSFIFVSAADSGTGTQGDRITDFTTGSDVINLSALDADPLAAGDQAFAFIGSATFSFVAGQVRVVDSGAGYGLLSVDIDGNGTSDFDIRVTGADGLTYVPVLSDLLL
ncbi:M10 family metallopeptidase C-terminal domain-containing protein [Tabrizicola fusiformis]|uniref:M10 family metallopeptidase C-terminal domain-containing protein n=1 Tax=Tabrizicola sp. SY72 TaxID=2741673 RepID=UPI001572B9DB|nr:FG-GAP repeat protein [Tabrizicola sp. SY72]NTT87859.1 FG-GAP repeat protein [Tabrizicola sp. SY72]